MTARLLSSIIWVCILVLPPSRELVRLLAVAVWPNKDPFARVGGVDAPTVPVIVVVVLGYALTIYLGQRFLLPWLQSKRPTAAAALSREGRTLVFPVVVAVFMTLGWLLLLTIKGGTELHHVLIALLVLAGVLDPRRDQVPTPTPPGPGPVPPDGDDELYPEDSEDDQFYYRNYQWLFDEEPYRRSGRVHTMRLGLKIPRAGYDDYKARSHAVHSDADYVRFINEELNDEVVGPLAAKLRRLVAANGFDDLAEIHLAMAFTLSFTYASDDGEYPMYPVELLVDRAGDCEDHANLCGAVLHGLGHRTALVLMDITRRTGHAALAVAAPVAIPGASFRDPRTGEQLFYCEVTPAGGATTRETTAVQWYLGGEPMEGARNFTLWEIGPSGSRT